MTSRSMKLKDLRRWNRLQIAIVRKLSLSQDPDAFYSFSAWFAAQVDKLGRFPRLAEVAEAFTAEHCVFPG